MNRLFYFDQASEEVTEVACDDPENTNQIEINGNNCNVLHLDAPGEDVHLALVSGLTPSLKVRFVNIAVPIILDLIASEQVN